MKRLAILLFAAASLMNCSDDAPKKNTATATDCKTPATIVKLDIEDCGFVFQLEDGSYVKPVIRFFCGTPPFPEGMEEDPLLNYQFKEGKKVFIEYTDVEGYFSTCIMHPVFITCIRDAEVTIQEEKF